MADATLQILGLGTGAVPVDYNVTGNQALDLIAVKVDFDGTSAAVDFVPVVEILSDADHVMAQAKGPTVTAGDSATVTFAPFLNDLDTSGSSAGVSAREILSFLAPSVAAGTDTGAVFTKVAGGQPDLFDLTVNTVPACLVAGTYTFIIFVQSSGTFNNGGYYTSQFQIYDTTPQGYFLLDFAGPFGANVFVPGRVFSAANPMLVGDGFQLDFANADTAGFHSFGGSVFIVRTGG